MQPRIILIINWKINNNNNNNNKMSTIHNFSLDHWGIQNNQLDHLRFMNVNNNHILYCKVINSQHHWILLRLHLLKVVLIKMEFNLSMNREIILNSDHIYLFSWFSRFSLHLKKLLWDNRDKRRDNTLNGALEIFPNK